MICFDLSADEQTLGQQMTASFALQAGASTEQNTSTWHAYEHATFQSQLP